MKYIPEFELLDSKFNSNQQSILDLKGKTVLLKYGGSTVKDRGKTNTIILDLCYLKWKGAIPVIVHGGGPVISELLNMAGIESQFIGGQRVTNQDTIEYVEMALKGKANNQIIRQFNALGFKSIGISGCDGFMVTAKQRFYNDKTNSFNHKIDLGFVGDVDAVNTELLATLTSSGYIPVIAPLAFGEDNNTYNINADIFAGAIAAKLKAAYYISVTDVDGLRYDYNDENTLITEITMRELLEDVYDTLDGGMIPKIESCIYALKHGVREVLIVNGNRDHIILESLLSENSVKTRIIK